MRPCGAIYRMMPVSIINKDASRAVKDTIFRNFIGNTYSLKTVSESGIHVCVFLELPEKGVVVLAGP